MDRSTLAIAASIPLNGHVMTQLSGPSADILLTPKDAYFITVRYTDGAGGQQPNQEGGFFDLNRVTLADGRIETFPLPKRCANPRVTSIAESPVVYSWNGFGVWQLGRSDQSLTQIISVSDVPDVFRREFAAERIGERRQGAFSDYVMLPGAGVFRLSQYGELHQILDSQSRLVQRPRRTLNLARDAEVLKVFPVNDGTASMLGAVQRKDAGLVVITVDPHSFKVTNEWQIPRSAVVESIYSAQGDIYYVDREKVVLSKVSQQGTKEVTSLRVEGSALDLFEARVIAVNTAK
jgi:hypothetical protein